MMASPVQSERRRVSPYARRLARERGIELSQLNGSGPSGRIVAADIVAFVPRPAPMAYLQATAIATSVELSVLRQLLEGFAKADTGIELDDIVLRAAACALDDIIDLNRPEGLPIALEVRSDQGRKQVVLDRVRSGSLVPLHARRLAALASGDDQSMVPAMLSLRILGTSDIRPITMPLLAGRAMRLVLAAGVDRAECLLSFDTDTVDEDAATAFLLRFKGYIEVPLRLLA